MDIEFKPTYLMIKRHPENPFSDVCGANNINYDPTIHTFTNKKTGMTVQMTQSEFVTKFNLSRQNVNAVIKERRKSVSGWILKNYSTYNQFGYNLR